VAGPFPRGHGTTGLARGRIDSGRKGQTPQVHPPPATQPGRCERRPPPIHGRGNRRPAAAPVSPRAEGQTRLDRRNVCHQPPHVLFAAQCGPRLDANAITLRLQPNEGISLRFNGKVPGTSMEIRPVRMHFSYDSEFGAYTPEAYERLLLEALVGDATLFIRRDEVEAAWGIVDPIRQAWEGRPL